MIRRSTFGKAFKSLRDFAKSFPLATEDHPWGETAIKVKGKVFLFLSLHDGDLHLSVKLPVSAATALGMPFAEPTSYGLGKHGWVTSTFATGDSIPVILFREWIDESYRAVAPKSELARLEQEEDHRKAAPGKPRNASKHVR
jgi:predicted DNA-binding protein (MmcQ/YjbR family)